MNPKSKDRDLESKMKVTVPNLIRAAGLSAAVAGVNIRGHSTAPTTRRSCVCQHQLVRVDHLP